MSLCQLGRKLKLGRSIARDLESTRKFLDRAEEDAYDGVRADGIDAGEISASFEIISAHFTQEYTDAVEAEKLELLARIERARVPATGPIQKEWGSASTTGSAPQLQKTKSKTHPTEQLESLQETNQGIANLVIDTPLELVKVTRRAHDMLTLMIPAAISSVGRAIEWNMFVHAMNDFVFSARNIGGSAVLFVNDERGQGEKGGKIIFHKPHPDPKIDGVRLCTMGRRMSKWFGWHRDLLCWSKQFSP